MDSVVGLRESAEIHSWSIVMTQSREIVGKSSNCQEKARVCGGWHGAGSHRVEAVIDEVFQVLAHADLPHQLILVAVHACQLSHVGKNILQPVCQLQESQPSDSGPEPAPEPHRLCPVSPSRQGSRQHGLTWKASTLPKRYCT